LLFGVAACLLVLGAGGCSSASDSEDIDQAIRVLDKLYRHIAHEEYQSAMRCFTPTAQKRIRVVGGGPTPIEGFFRGLRPKLSDRRDTRIGSGAVWVTYGDPQGDEMHVSVRRNEKGKWLISRIVARQWNI
jgi:hypothetical protein